MTLIADTTPLNYLTLIGHMDLLPQLFGTVLIPSGIRDEMLDTEAPPMVRRRVSNLPAWLEVRPAPPITSPRLLAIDPGEREAIQLELHLNTGTVLMDDAEGRRVATALGLRAHGTLGLLERGARAGRCNFREGTRKAGQHQLPYLAGNSSGLSEPQPVAGRRRETPAQDRSQKSSDRVVAYIIRVSLPFARGSRLKQQ